MGNEITYSVNFQCRNGNFIDDYNPGQISVDQNAVGRGGYVQSITALATEDAEVIDFGDVVTNGICILRNLDATYSVVYGPETAPGTSGTLTAFGRLKPGEYFPVRIAPDVVMRAYIDDAGTAEPTVKLEVRLYED